MGCVFTYKGVDYNTREELSQAVLADYKNGNIEIPFQEFNKEGLHILEGSLQEVEVRKIILEEEASNQYGSVDFISYVEKGGRTYVKFDYDLLDDLTNPHVKLLKNNNTGKIEEVDIADVARQYKLTGEIPNYEKAEFHLQQYLFEEIKENLLNEAISEAQTPKRENELMQRLKAFATSLGVGVTTLENYIENFGKRNGSDITVEALADIMRRLIALSDQNDVSKLVEEVAHFAIEYFGDQEILQRMVDRVDKTLKYQRESAKIRAIYENAENADGTKLTAEEAEERVRKEVLGLILMDRIMDNFSEETASNSTEIGIINQLKNLWERLKNIFTINDNNRKFFRDFGEVLDIISQDVLRNRADNYSARTNNAVYFSAFTKEDKAIDIFLKENIRKLERKYQAIATNDRLSRTDKQSQLNAIREALTKNAYREALLQYLAVITEDINHANGIIASAKQNSPENFIEAIGQVDIQNVSVFTDGAEHTLDAIIDFLRGESSRPDEGLTKEHISSLLNKAKGTLKMFQNIREDLREIRDSKFLEDQARVLDNSNITGDLRKKFEDLTKAGIYKSAMSAQRWLTSLFSSGNPIIQLALFTFGQAKTRVEDATSDVTQRLRELQRKTGVTQERIRQLVKGHHIIAPFKYSQAELDYEEQKEIVRKKYDERIAAVDKKLSNEEQELIRKDILTQRDSELRDLAEEWEITKYNRDYYNRLRNIHPDAVVIIKNRAIARSKIFSKYKDSSGNIRADLMSKSDLTKLQALQTNLKLKMSDFYADGSAKEGLQKIIAKDLQSYYAYTGEDIKFRMDDFKREQERILARYGEYSEEYANWLKAYARQTYPQEVFDLIEKRVVDVDSTEIPDEDIQTIKKILGLNEANNYSLQQLYEKLVEKRRQLLAPYRANNEFNEVDGVQIEQNPLLLQALDEVQVQLRKFSLEEAANGLEYLPQPNKAFIRKYNELKRNKNFAELRAFVRLHASVEIMEDGTVSEERYETFTDDYGNTYPIPKTHYYRTYRVNGAELVHEPNYFWVAEREELSELNPEYNEAFSGKGIMFNHKKLPQYIDNEYFELFGIDPQEVFAAGATGFGTPTKNLDLWEVYQELLSIKENVDKNQYQIGNQYFLLPQIEADEREIAKIGVGKTIKAVLKRTFTLDVDDDSVGEVERKVKEGGKGVERLATTQASVVPKRYTNKLRDSEVISHNLSRTYGRYFEAGMEYKEYTRILPELFIYKEKLRNATFKSRKSGRPGEETNLYKMLEEWIDTNIYGHTHNEVGVFRVSLGQYGQHDVSASKTIKALYRWISKTNLGYNIFVPITGWITAQVAAHIEAYAGNYTTKESMLWAEKKTARNIPTYLSDFGSINPQNEAKKLFEFSRVNVDPQQIYDGVFASRAFRASKDTIMNAGYIHYSMLGTTTAMQAMYSVFDNYRLFKDNSGKFIFGNKKTFLQEAKDRGLTEQQANDEWKTLRTKSYYNYLVNEKDKPIYLDEAKLRADGYEGSLEGLNTSMRRNAKDFHQQMEGLISPEDRAAIQRNPLLMFFAMHRGWLQSAVQQRFKARQINLYTGSEEEGTYMTFGRLFSDSFSAEAPISFFGLMGYITTLGAYSRGVENLQEFEKANLRRLGGDLAAYLGTMALFILMNIAADDDEDDYWKQYWAYISSRVFAEITATQLPFGIGEIYTIAQSPLAGVSMMEDMINAPAFFWEMFKDEKLVKTGAYEGMENWQKELIKKTPIKNIFEPLNSNARRSNLFFRTKTISPIQLNILEAIEKDMGIRE